jgi:hypothetical protein
VNIGIVSIVICVVDDLFVAFTSKCVLLEIKRREIV